MAVPGCHIPRRAWSSRTTPTPQWDWPTVPLSHSTSPTPFGGLGSIATHLAFPPNVNSNTARVLLKKHCSDSYKTILFQNYFFLVIVVLRIGFLREKNCIFSMLILIDTKKDKIQLKHWNSHKTTAMLGAKKTRIYFKFVSQSTQAISIFTIF